MKLNRKVTYILGGVLLSGAISWGVFSLTQVPKPEPTPAPWKYNISCLQSGCPDPSLPTDPFYYIEYEEGSHYTYLVHRYMNH